MCCLNWWAASATISWKASSIWLIIPVWNSCQGCSMLKRVWVELLTKMRRALKDQAKSEWMILGVKHFHSARNLWLYCKDPNIWMNCPLYNENEVDIKKRLKKQTMMCFRYNRHIIPLTEGLSCVLFISLISLSLWNMDNRLLFIAQNNVKR